VEVDVVALAVVLSGVVLLLAVLVAGLLRSHADILKSLHDLGVGVGEPGMSPGGQEADHRHAEQGLRQVPITLGPTLPAERSSTSSFPVVDGDHLTLLAFLSSGCSTCAGFWSALRHHRELGLPAHTRLVVVTKGADMEIPAEVAAQAPTDLPVVMSTEAWADYEVPGSPFFVLVDGRDGRRIGEGVANHIHQVVELVRRAEADALPFDLATRRHTDTSGLDGPARELANDRELLAAGILPGDPSLYPGSAGGVPAPGASRAGTPVERPG
jgi:hypothetical protein